jgi:hypothetical protein
MTDLVTNCNQGALPLIPHFILFLDKKNEARKINLPAWLSPCMAGRDKTIANALCCKAGISNKVSQAPLLKFHALQHYSH